MFKDLKTKVSSMLGSGDFTLEEAWEVLQELPAVFNELEREHNRANAAVAAVQTMFEGEAAIRKHVEKLNKMLDKPNEKLQLRNNTRLPEEV